MKKLIAYLTLAMILGFSVSAPGEEGIRISSPGQDVIYGGVVGAAKAARDTVLLMGPWGSGAPFNGQFQNLGGAEAWNFWTHQDLTVGQENHWHVSDYNAIGLNGHGEGNLAAWCGSLEFPACDVTDALGGYGTNWNDALLWTGFVIDPGQSCVAMIDAFLNIDVEPGYDYVLLECFYEGQDAVEIASWDGAYSNLHVQETVTFQPGDFMGAAGNEVRVQFRVISDSGWDDADCQFPSSGACQLDDVSVSLDNGGFQTFNDFQSGSLGLWMPQAALGVGDFAHLEFGLDDRDPCAVNNSPQVCFIDDGEVVPGTGGTKCITWCYGPGGYIVNNTGGLLGEAYHLDNAVDSPIMPIPAGMEGLDYAYDLYWHEDFSSESAGMFYEWSVRSTASVDPADIEQESWENRSFLYHLAGPEYYRFVHSVGDLLQPNATYVQVRFQLKEMGWIWGWDGADGTPAPYYDNVRVSAYDFEGPGLSVSSVSLANDGFPASGGLDLENPGANSVRFDMARNISPAIDQLNDPGDSVVVRVVAQRAGSTLNGMPRMYYKLKANSVFDPYRSSGLPSSGSVPGWAIAAPTLDGFAFDLPDTGFLFPGDELHYYFRAEDDLGGIAILPADTTGFSDFADILAYNALFTMRALPTVWDEGEGQFGQPEILFWDDSGTTADSDEWAFAFRNIGHDPGLTYDIYRTQAASSGVGNGLGGRATVTQLAGYTEILYSSGDQFTYTLSTGEFDWDPSLDVQLLDAWLRLGERDIFLTGNQLGSDLSYNPAGQDFLRDWMGLSLSGISVQHYTNGLVSPGVVPDEGNPVLFEDQGWMVYGGCPSPDTFDAVLPVGTAVRLAQFADPTGEVDVYEISAATLNIVQSFNSRVISLPYDLSNIWTQAAAGSASTTKAAAPIPTRAEVLQDILAFLNPDGDVGLPTSVTLPVGVLTARNFPNPFNPTTKIMFDLPSSEHLTLKVFNVKGERVRTLVNEVRPAGPGFVMWDGADDSGGQAASGLYFYEVRTAQDVRVQKMVLLK
ncbi:MAG: hypothetical protein KOO60_08550 [Gemmatimonadales bacterium]|nr:hypothetical protein [Gemmatimonadales bacterium]